MELKFKIVVDGVNSCGTELHLSFEGHGNNVYFNIAHLKVSSKIWDLLNEEYAFSQALHKKNKK